MKHFTLDTKNMTLEEELKALEEAGFKQSGPDCNYERPYTKKERFQVLWFSSFLLIIASLISLVILALIINTCVNFNSLSIMLAVVAIFFILPVATTIFLIAIPRFQVDLRDKYETYIVDRLYREFVRSVNELSKQYPVPERQPKPNFDSTRCLSCKWNKYCDRSNCCGYTRN